MLDDLLQKFRSLHEFYDSDDIDNLVVDIATLCMMEKMYLEKKSNGILEDKEYKQLKLYRFVERIDEFYNMTLDIVKQRDIAEMTYVPQRKTNIYRMLLDIYEPNR